MEGETRSIPTLASNQIPFVYRGLMQAGSESFTRIFICLAARPETVICSDNSRPLLVEAKSVIACTLRTMSEAMKHTFGLIRRPFSETGSALNGWGNRLGEPSRLEHGWL